MCEYCKVDEEDHFLTYHIDHFIGIKHGGTNDLENLIWACPYCNQNKGSDLVTVISSIAEYIPIFNPRKQKWSVHFYAENGEIIPKTLTGEATIKLLKFNYPDILIFRQILFQNGRYFVNSDKI